MHVKALDSHFFYSYWKRESRHFGNGILWRSTFGGLILVWNPDKWKTITGILPTNVRSYTRSTSSRSDDSLSRPGLIPLLAVKSIYFLINLTCGFLFFFSNKDVDTGLVFCFSTNKPNSTKKRASRASALRADGAPYIRGLVLTTWTSPTSWTRP